VIYFIDHDLYFYFYPVYKKSLESYIKGDTSGYFQRLLVALCQGRRDENPNVDMAAAAADANSLHKAGKYLFYKHIILCIGIYNLV
jgi:hypothetical protein